MDTARSIERQQSGRGTLGWVVFLVIAVVVVATLIAGVIRGGLSSPDSSGARPSLSGAPSPSPTPLPRPGAAPPRT